jgi:hypothetical protein
MHFRRDGRHARLQGRDTISVQASFSINLALGPVELHLVLEQASVVVISEGERCACARGWNLELVNDFLPKLKRAHSLVAAPQDYSFEEFAKIEFTTPNRRHFKVVIAHE